MTSCLNLMKMMRLVMLTVSSCLLSSVSSSPSHPSYHPYHPPLHPSGAGLSSFVMPVIHSALPTSAGSVSASSSSFVASSSLPSKMMMVSRPSGLLSRASSSSSRRGARGVSSSSPLHQQHLVPPSQQHQQYHHHSQPSLGLPSHTSPHVSSHVSSSSVFIPRSLWMDPLDYPVFPLPPSFSSSSSVHSMIPSMSFVPSASVSSSASSPSQSSSPSSVLSLNPSDQRGISSSSSTSSSSSVPSASASNTVSSSPLNIMAQNSSVGVGQEQAMFEKSVMDLLTLNPNFTLPLSYDKFLWTFNNDPMRYEQFHYYPLHYFPASGSYSTGNNNLEGMTPTEIQSLGSSPSDFSPPSNIKEMGSSSVLYSHGTEHLKVVSLCDKTLALLDYGNPTSNQLLRCELFDLEKSPEMAYTEAKKTGIPIQSVSFREMREIINACRVLSEADFSPNTVSVGSPPPPIPVSSHPGVLHDFTMTNPGSNSNHVNGNNNNNNLISGTAVSSNETTSSPSAVDSISSGNQAAVVVSVSASSSSSSSSSSASTSSPSASQSSSSSSSSSPIASPSSSSVQSSGPSSVSSISASSSSTSSSSPSSPTSSSSVSSSSTSSSPSSASSSSSDKGSSLWSSWRALLPGTKWCGLGDSARNYFDLGKRKDVDVCCRAHDHCPIRLKALRMGYGLINLSLYTKSHCDCDEDFKRCLRQANSKSAEMLANFYFNIMKVQCLREDVTFVCREYRKNKTTGIDECIRYEEDNKNANKMVFVQPEVVTFK